MIEREPAGRRALLVHCLVGGRQRGRASLRRRGPCPLHCPRSAPWLVRPCPRRLRGGCDPCNKSGPGILPGPVSFLENDAQKVMLQLSM